MNKIFYRYHYDEGITLTDMQERCNLEKRGLCAVTELRHLYTKSGDLTHPGGEILVMKGEIWGLCAEGYTVYPLKILKRIEVPDNQFDYDLFVNDLLKEGE